MPATTSHRRALLISSPRNGLTATGPSLLRMREFLTRQGFIISDEACIDGARATRAEILAGFAALLEATASDDVVVVYYAGHGALFPDNIGTLVRSHPVLEPMDIADSDADHFNGLLGGELRLLLRALARLSDNVTAIFDCCHAAGLVSADQPASDVDEAEDRATMAAIAQRAGDRIHRRRLAAGPTMRSRDNPAPGIVRLVASSASERAYAYQDRPLLLFTDILVSVLEQHALAEGLTWEQIVRVVRSRLQQIRPEQRPGVEGARDRRPFTTTTDPTPVDHFHVERIGPRLRLCAGAAAGVAPHDRFELLAYAGTCERPTIACAVVVAPFHAYLELPRRHDPLPDVMFARRLRTAAPLAARIHASDPAAAEAHHGALAKSGHILRDPAFAPTPADHIDVVDEFDPDQAPDFTPQRVARVKITDPDAADELARAARRLERWAGLAARLVHPGLGPLAGCYTLTWGRAVGDDIEALRPGEVVRAGQPLAVHLHNPGRASALHLQVYRVRADRCIDAWRDVDGGLAVQTGHTLALQETFDRVSDLPGPHREWLVIAIGDGAFELQALATPTGDRPIHGVTRSSGRRPGEASRVEIFGASYLLGPRD